MDVVVIRQAERELNGFPDPVRVDVFALFEDLAAGKLLGMPIARSLPSIAKGLFELRLSGRAGEFRVFYVVKVRDAIYVVHAAQKKNQKIDKRTIELITTRIRSIGI